MDEYITELANDIAKSCPDLVENGCGNDNCVACLAFKLIGLGYQKQRNTADVVPKSEEGAECPTCHGTGRIGTTDWLTKNITKEQLAKEKAEAIAEHEQHIKQDYASEIFAEIEENLNNLIRYYKEKREYVTEIEYSELEQRYCDIKIRTFEERLLKIAELKKKYTE